MSEINNFGVSRFLGVEPTKEIRVNEAVASEIETESNVAAPANSVINHSDENLVTGSEPINSIKHNDIDLREASLVIGKLKNNISGKSDFTFNYDDYRLWHSSATDGKIVNLNKMSKEILNKPDIS